MDEFDGGFTGGRSSAREDAGAPPPPFAPGYAKECMTCPFGLFLFAMRQTKPEVTEHLTKAAMELMLAVKSFMDGASERWKGADTLQKIPVR